MRNLAQTALALALLFVCVSSADAFTTLSGTVNNYYNYDLGTYYSGGTGYTGTSPADNYAYALDGAFDATAANDLDRHWIQGDAQTGVIWTLDYASSLVAAFPSIDHGPVPDEALEFTIYGSNDLSSWETGLLTFVIEDGWVDNGTTYESDDWASIWSFSADYLYIKVVAGGPGAILSDGDFEMDAIGAASPVPEPATLLLMGFGLVGGGFMRRRLRK
jgi:hypothetical protein